MSLALLFYLWGDADVVLRNVYIFAFCVHSVNREGQFYTD